MQERVVAALLQHTQEALLSQSGPSSKQQRDERLLSGALCSTSCTPSSLQHARAYAKKGGAPKPAAGGSSAVTEGADDYSPPKFLAHRHAKRDPFRELPQSQRKLLQSLVPSGEKLRSPRQIGWDLGPEQTMALLHQTMGQVAGEAVTFTPFVVTDLLQSARTVAEWVKLVLESGEDFSSVEKFFVQLLAAEPRPDVRGIKVQIKGRLSGKGGKASKKVWQTGAPGAAQLSEPVDSAKAAADTSAGLIGIKVWVVYAKDAVGRGTFFDTRLVSPHTLEEVLAMPRVAAVKASSSAWWAVPGPLQPAQFGAGRPFRAGFDPLRAFGGGGGAAGGDAGGGEVAAASSTARGGGSAGSSFEQS